MRIKRLFLFSFASSYMAIELVADDYTSLPLSISEIKVLGV